MDSKKNGKRKRHYRAMAYGAKKSKFCTGKNVIQESLKGFIIVCNGREKEAIREAYRILNETLESEKTFGDDINSQDNSADEEDESIEAALAREKAELSSEDKNFQLVYTAGVSNFMFLKSIPEPLPIATKIMDSILKDGKQRTRYLIRLIPIQNVCKAFPDPIKASVGALITKLNLQSESLSYCVAFKSRFNNSVTQVEAVQAVNEAVGDATKGNWKIQLKGCDYVIVLEVVTKYCCIGILPQYQQRKKYNLIELAKSVSVETDKSTEEGEDLKDQNIKPPPCVVESTPGNQVHQETNGQDNVPDNSAQTESASHNDGEKLGSVDEKAKSHEEITKPD